MGKPQPDKRTRLIETAMKLAYRNGFRETSLADIAQAAHVPVGNVFNCLAKFFLGLEVVVNVPYRNMGGLGDVRQARLSETVPVRQLHGGLIQPCPLVWVWFPYAHVS